MFDAKVQVRFWSKVDIRKSDECWEWTAHRCRLGYGRFRLGGEVQGAHRIAWELSNGCLLGDLYCLHSCDNPGCVNPSHLRQGTQKDNMRDMIKKGRYPKLRNMPAGDDHWSRRRPELIARGPRHGAYVKGEIHRCTKLTESDVSAIRQQRGGGALLRELADKFGISISTAGNICQRKTWAHVP